MIVGITRRKRAKIIKKVVRTVQFNDLRLNWNTFRFSAGRRRLRFLHRPSECGTRSAGRAVRLRPARARDPRLGLVGRTGHGQVRGPPSRRRRQQAAEHDRQWQGPRAETGAPAHGQRNDAPLALLGAKSKPVNHEELGQSWGECVSIFADHILWLLRKPPQLTRRPRVPTA